MNEIVPSDMKLKSFGNDFLDQFTESVEENNQSEGLGMIVRWFIWLQDDNCGGQFEMCGLMAEENVCIGYIDEVIETVILFQDRLEMTP